MHPTDIDPSLQEMPDSFKRDIWDITPALSRTYFRHPVGCGEPMLILGVIVIIGRGHGRISRFRFIIGLRGLIAGLSGAPGLQQDRHQQQKS